MFLEENEKVPLHVPIMGYIEVIWHQWPIINTRNGVSSHDSIIIIMLLRIIDMEEILMSQCNHTAEVKQ